MAPPSPGGLLAVGAAALAVVSGSEEAFRNVPGSGLVKYAAWSVLAEEGSGGVFNVIGQAQKHPGNPLLVQDKPWDARWDNGYPNIEHTPGSSQGEFQLWYGGFVTRERENAWHYANSSDGLAWEKPELGIVDLAQARGATPAMIAAGTRNNVLMLDSDGMGILLDRHEPNRSRAFKSIGTGCFDQRAVGRCLSGSAMSDDGLHWTDAEAIRWPKPHGWDDHQNFFFDPSLGRYVLTTRLWLNSSARGGGTGAAAANAAAASGEAGGAALERTIAVSLGSADGSFGGWSMPALTLRGNAEHQTYSQVTWPYYNVYLGIAMVFDTRAPATAGTVHCRLVWAPAPLGPWRWVAEDGLTGPELPPIAGPGAQAFDSHICFAAHLPLVIGGKIWLYYMGGNGPHNGDRNSSLGLATLRPDGFAGISAGPNQTRVATVPILVTGETLVVTADIVGIGGFVRIGVPDHAALGPSRCRPISENTTDEALLFEGGADFGQLVGRRVALELVLHRAVLYTFGFAERAEPRPRIVV